MARIFRMFRMIRISRLVRYCKRPSVLRRITLMYDVLLLYVTYLAITISWEAYQTENTLWYVTRYRMGLFIGSDDTINKYFTSNSPLEPLVHEDVRALLRQEYLKTMEASSLNYTIHFNNLERKVESIQNNELQRLNYTGIGVDSFKTFMQKFADLTIENSLSFPHPEREVTNEGKPVIWDTIFVDDAYARISFEYLSSIMEFDDVFLLDLKLKHKIITSLLPQGDCPYFDNMNSSGYVLLGGSTYSWYSLLAIQSLRNVGSKLPVELIIPSQSDVDKSLCEKVLPMYNAKCLVLEKVYPKDVLKKLNASGYQLKALAILASSFKNTLYLDSDVFTVENPDGLFTSDLYAKYGMITWPDFWRRTTSPVLYESMNLNFTWKPIRFLNDYFTPHTLLYKDEELKHAKEEVNLHDLKGTLPDWSTEAGLLLVNKSTHFSSLLLALYYNINGPAGYYPLLSQGGAGEGDKETWPFASHVLNQTWWQVNRQPDKTYGTWIKDRNWIVDSCIVQVDPLEDWEGVLGLVWTQENWRTEMIDRGGYVYNYDYSFGKQGYDYAEIMGAALGNGGMASFSKDGAKFWEMMYEVDDENVKHYPVPILAKPRDMFYHVHSPKVDPWNYVLDNLFTDLNEKQMRNFGDIWTRLGWDFELWVWETVRENLCGLKDENSSVNGLNFDQVNIVKQAVSELKCFQGRDYERVCSGDKRRLDKRIEWLKKDGEKALKKSNKPPAGWKLAGSERSRIQQIVEQSWEEYK